MKENDKKNLYSLYIGLASQLMIGLALSVYIGIWIDKKTNVFVPIFVWLFPLIYITGVIIKIIKDTSK